MRASRLALVAAVALAACTDTGVPTSDPSLPLELPTAASISDANNDGNPDFYFLPPLVGDVTPTGTFNGKLAPVVSICQVATLAELDALNGNKPLSERDIRDFLDEGAFLGGQTASLQCPTEVRRIAASELKATLDAYQSNWDTDGVETVGLDDGDFVRLRVFLSEADRAAWEAASDPQAEAPASAPLGYIDLFATDPSGNSPSEDQVGLYAFRLGEKIPVKFWTSEGIVCDPSQGEVAECTEVAWDDNVGVSAFLDGGQRVGFSCAAECRTNDPPGNFETVTLVVERLKLKRDFPNDPEALEECITDLALPTAGPCLRLRTVPELPAAEGISILDEPGIIAVCSDLSEFGAAGENAQLIRQSDDGLQKQFLSNTPTPLCPEVVGLRSDAFGDHSLGRLAVRTLNGVARLLGPDPLVAGDYVGGLSRRLSNFQWAVPCQLNFPGGVAADGGDGQFGRAEALLSDPLSIQCLDADGQGVNGARIRFRSSDAGGSPLTVDVSGSAVASDTDGFYVITSTDGAGNGGRADWSWAPSARGSNTLEAYGLGLIGPGDDFPTHCYVVEGTPEASEDNGCTVVSQADLDGGEATGQVIQVDLPEGSLSYSATVSGAPAEIATAFTFGDATVGSELGPIDITVNDATTGTVYGVPGETVTWSITDGGCLILPDDDSDADSDPQEYCSQPVLGGGFTTATVTTVTNGDGETSITWRLGTGAGTQSITVSAGNVTETYNVNAQPADPSSLEIVAGNNQTADAGTSLPALLTVQARDQYNNVTTNADANEWSVAWSVTSGGGSLTPTSATIA
ncbi:MAG: hypothetical protein JSU98_16485, partial [Gemmatimonadales bacterium]